MALTRMQQRRGVASQWASENPILGAGEIGFETDNNRFKIGDGLSNWTALDYFSNATDVDAAISAAISEVIDLAPETLDTLNEIAAAINDDPNFFTNVVSRAGDTMTGDLTLPNDPTQPLHAATKQYVESYTDGEIASLISSGETITPGGTEGQVLAKVSDTDYDTEWVTPTGLLGDLEDVETVGVADKDTLVYDDVLGLWLPGPGGGRFNVSETPPAEPLNGDTWLDSVTGNTYLYYEDYDNPQWIQIGGPGITVTRGASLFIQTTAPSAPVEGDIWYDAAEGFTYLYYVDVDSSQWIQFGLNRNGASGTDGVDGTNGTDGADGADGDLTTAGLETYNNGNIATNLIPDTNSAYDLGEPEHKWRFLYTSDIVMSNEENPNDVDGTWGSYVIQEGENDLFLINKRNGKSYRFVIEEIDQIMVK